MRTRVSDRSGDGVVSVVHGPVSQAGLPAADVRRSVSRTWCRDADRRSVSNQRRRLCRRRSRLLDRLQRSSRPEHQILCS